MKFGGRLVYATCSLLDEENDGIAAQFLATHPDFALVPMHQVLAEQRIALDMGDYLKMLPHKHGTDGFFAAVFERKANTKAASTDSGTDADTEADAE